MFKALNNYENVNKGNHSCKFKYYQLQKAVKKSEKCDLTLIEINVICEVPIQIKSLR